MYIVLNGDTNIREWCSVPDVSPRACLIFCRNPKWNATSLSDSSPLDRRAAIQSYILRCHTVSKMILCHHMMRTCSSRPKRFVIDSCKFARAWKAEIMFVKWSRQCTVCLWSAVLRVVSKTTFLFFVEWWCRLSSEDVCQGYSFSVPPRHISRQPMGNVGEWSTP